MRNLITILVLFSWLLAAPFVLAETNAKVELRPGGDELLIKSGGLLDVQAGATFKVLGATQNASASEVDAVADLSARGILSKAIALDITSTPTGSEQDTGWDLPPNAIVIGVGINVTTAEASGGTKTLDVGLLSSETSGDTDGFISSLAVTTVGVTVPTVSHTTGANEVYLATSTWGALLATFQAGSDSATDVGTFYRKYHTTSWATARSVVYQADSNDWAEFRGSILLFYLEVE